MVIYLDILLFSQSYFSADATWVHFSSLPAPVVLCSLLPSRENISMSKIGTIALFCSNTKPCLIWITCMLFELPAWHQMMSLQERPTCWDMNSFYQYCLCYKITFSDSFWSCNGLQTFSVQANTWWMSACLITKGCKWLQNRTPAWVNNFRSKMMRKA